MILPKPERRRITLLMKSRLRCLFESSVLWWVRLAIFTRDASRENKRLHRNGLTVRLPVLESEHFRMMKASKPDATTAFILGTGESVAELTDGRLDFIRAQFSIGVNQWILHPMIPDVYAYEVDKDVRLLQALERPSVREKSPYMLFLNPTRPEDFSNIDHMPEFMRPRAFVYGRVNIWTRRRVNIARDFISVMRLSSRRLFSGVVLDNGASIARMISLCISLGFREIVLTGVDLNSTEYFWHQDPGLLAESKVKDPRTSQRGSFHETVSAANRPFPIHVYLMALAPVLAQVGVNLRVESPKSLLAGSLPVFQWGGIS